MAIKRVRKYYYEYHYFCDKCGKEVNLNRECMYSDSHDNEKKKYWYCYNCYNNK